MNLFLFMKFFITLYALFIKVLLPGGADCDLGTIAVIDGVLSLCGCK